MPSVSKKQQRLIAAAEHGASFPKAQAIRESMTHQQMHDYASGSMAGKPEHVRQAPHKDRADRPSHPDHPHKNLGAYLHKPNRR